ncbi:MAG: hypothetical protein J5621_06540, partial [Paludibacteraceae bacterium]|nr:hypothetical protein [Paludibacteraceae bacterium]
NSIAQQVSKLLPEATILAPTEMLKAGSDGKVKQILGVAVEEAKTIKKIFSPEYSGCWNAYRNGELQGSSPSGLPTPIYLPDQIFAE